MTATINPYLGPAATLLVGCAIAFIAWQQWKIARNRLRLDLFDRRYRVYDATRKFLAVIVQDATFTDSQLIKFAAGTSDAGFLFLSDVVDYLATIRRRALDMRTHQHLYKHHRDSPDYERHVQAEHDQLLWLGEQITAMSNTFTPYLGFSNIK